MGSTDLDTNFIQGESNIILLVGFGGFGEASLLESKFLTLTGDESK